MKVRDLREILLRGSELYGATGTPELSRALAELANVLKVADALDVDEFVGRIHKTRRERRTSPAS